ncbi:MAG: hypothetical protein SYC29_17125 [Planctomycetota bacterium]|nr:hypothetical protein [Planctomycetota bacterium]
MDLAVSNGASDDASILLNNGDGTFVDSARYDAGNSPRSLALNNLNGDGDTDTADLLALLGAWGECP